MEKTKSLILFITIASAGCSLLPEYQKPVLAVPAKYKEELAGWKSAEPKEIAQKNWWQGYQDAQLESLLAEARVNNQNVQVAAAQYRQAEALLSSSKGPLLPRVSVNGDATRSQPSIANTQNSNVRNNFNATITAFWEVDLWGRIRSNVNVNAANLAASRSDLAAIQLSIQTTLAQQYFQLRVLDTQQVLLNKNVTAFESTLKLVKNRYEVGLVSRADVAQAEARYRSTKAQATSNKIQREQLENAIAVLLGKPSSDFSLNPMPYAENQYVFMPTIPKNIPSELLERRPDIVAAERRVASANAQIGVAKTAYFPTLSISGAYGAQSRNFSDLFSIPSRIWSLGPSLASIIFDGGERKGLTNAAIANHDASASTYKQTVLNAFQEVEDNLVALKLLDEQAVDQDLAVKASREALEKTLNLYKAGNINYTNLITVQINTLNNETAALNILSAKLVASVGLIKSLGGSVNNDNSSEKN